MHRLLISGQVKNNVENHVENRVETAALGCPAEQSSAIFLSANPGRAALDWRAGGGSPHPGVLATKKARAGTPVLHQCYFQAKREIADYGISMTECRSTLWSAAYFLVPDQLNRDPQRIDLFLDFGDFLFFRLQHFKWILHHNQSLKGRAEYTALFCCHLDSRLPEPNLGTSRRYTPEFLNWSQCPRW